MEYFSNADTWVSFYLAIRHSLFDPSCVIQHMPHEYLITYEISATSHKETGGQHVHVLFRGSDVLYRKVIHLIKQRYNLQGVAKNGVPRQYGKVRDLRDPFRMAAYLVKQSGQTYTNLPEKTLSLLQETSFENFRESETSRREKTMAYLDQVIDLSNPLGDSHYINFTENSLVAVVKEALIDYHRSDCKFLTRHTLNYLTHYYLVYHNPKIFSSREILSLFY